jgi:hypothetical protein
VARPRTGETPIRHVRVSDELWAKVGEVARRQKRTLSAVVVDALERYVGDQLGGQGDTGRQESYVLRLHDGEDAGKYFAVDHYPDGWPEEHSPVNGHMTQRCPVPPVWKVERTGSRGKRLGHVSYYCDKHLPSDYRRQRED